MGDVSDVVARSRWRNDRSHRTFVVLEVRDRDDLSGPYREALTKRETGARSKTWESVVYITENCTLLYRPLRREPTAQLYPPGAQPAWYVGEAAWDCLVDMSTVLRRVCACTPRCASPPTITEFSPYMDGYCDDCTSHRCDIAGHPDETADAAR